MNSQVAEMVDAGNGGEVSHRQVTLGRATRSIEYT
jgi:hypothetical protein